MRAEVRQFDNEPIYLITMPVGYDLRTDLAQEIPGLMALLDQQPEPVVWIADIDQVEFEVDTVIESANLLSQGKNAFYHHPKIRHVIHITNLPHIRMATMGMKNESFGSVNISVADSLEDALRQARELISQGQ